MGKWKVWFLIALGILGSFVVWALLGRNLWNAANNVSCFDTSEHKVSFVTVEPDVQLEVLDWGGTGETLVLLTGLGDNAHVYDQFAYQFTDRFHVIGITRRGFGRSSQPAHGYDLDTRARDDIAVLDKLNIRAGRICWALRCRNGTEQAWCSLSGSRQETCLPGCFRYRVGWMGNSPSTAASPGGYCRGSGIGATSCRSLSARSDGYRKPLAAICNMIRTDPSGRVVGAITPPEISSKIYAGLQPAEYDRIQAPALGIFNKITPQYRMPYYWYLDPAKQEEFNRSIKSLAKWIEGAIQRFRSGVKNSRVIELHDTNHYVFIVDEALVVREMRKFLLEE